MTSASRDDDPMGVAVALGLPVQTDEAREFAELYLGAAERQTSTYTRANLAAAWRSARKALVGRYKAEGLTVHVDFEWSVEVGPDGARLAVDYHVPARREIGRYYEVL